MPGRRKHDTTGSARNHRMPRSGHKHRQKRPRVGHDPRHPYVPWNPSWTSLSVKSAAIQAVAHADELTERFLKGGEDYGSSQRLLDVELDATKAKAQSRPAKPKAVPGANTQKVIADFQAIADRVLAATK